MDSIWSSIIRTYSPSQIELIGTLLVQLFSFWIPSIIYISLDKWAPKFSQRHKLQPSLKQPTPAEIRHCFFYVFKNQILSTVLHIIQLTAIHKFHLLPPPYRIHPTLPAPQIIARDILISLVLREILFYYGHRILHLPMFYARIHKRHHRFTAPVALAAQYAHPIEQIVANILPITLPPQLLGSHVVTFWLYMSYELFNTATVHSGFDFFAGKAKMHDLHHEKFNLNFGSLGLMDWVHGTDRLKVKSKVK